MNPKTKIIIAVLVAITALQIGCVFAAEEHPIDKKLGKCTEKNWTTDGMNHCMDQAYKEWDVELNKNYKLLMGVLSGEEKQLLKASQIAWIKYRDLETKFRMNTFTNLPGTMYTNIAMAEKLSIVSQRASELRQLYGTLEEVNG